MSGVDKINRTEEQETLSEPVHYSYMYDILRRRGRACSIDRVKNRFPE